MRQIDVIKVYEKKSCLIVDDLPEVRGTVKRMMQSLGVKKIDTAADADEAMVMCESRPYGLVLCDYNLGKSKDGQQLLEELRFMSKLPYTTLFIMITAESSREMVLGAIENQPDDYITKPIAPSHLSKRLDRALLKHQDLYDIKEAIDAKNFRRAVDLCSEKIEAGHKFTLDCKRYKAQLLTSLEDFEPAAEIYQSVLNERSLVWAQIGLARIKMQDPSGYDEAEEILHSVIAVDSRYIEAYDLLSQIEKQKNNIDEAQAFTLRATQLSPKSILRYRRLATLAELNNDNLTCLSAYQSAIRWNHNSCYAKADDYLNLARTTIPLVAGLKDRNSVDKAKSALSMLDRMRKRFPHEEKHVRAQLLECQLHTGQGKIDLGKSMAEQAESAFKALENPNIETRFDFVTSQLTCGSKQEANKELYLMARQYKNDNTVLERIDKLSDEPISLAGKKCAAELSRSGINAYKNKNYDDALKIFTDALCLYPNHTGLNLNLVQAALAKTNDLGPDERLDQLCVQCIRRVGELGEDNAQFTRFDFLLKQHAKLYGNDNCTQSV